MGESGCPWNRVAEKAPARSSPASGPGAHCTAGKAGLTVVRMENIPTINHHNLPPPPDSPILPPAPQSRETPTTGHPRPSPRNQHPASRLRTHRLRTRGQRAPHVGAAAPALRVTLRVTRVAARVGASLLAAEQCSQHRFGQKRWDLEVAHKGHLEDGASRTPVVGGLCHPPTPGPGPEAPRFVLRVWGLDEFSGRP